MMKIAVWDLHPVIFSPKSAFDVSITLDFILGNRLSRFKISTSYVVDWSSNTHHFLPSRHDDFYTSHENCLRLCDTCLASIGKNTHPSMSGKNFSLNAAWRMTRLDHQGYLDKESGNVSPYTSIEGFNVETVAYDLLHNVFLGCGRDLFASGLKLLISKGVWTHLGDDMDTILCGIRSEMHRTCASLGFLCLSSFFLVVCYSHVKKCHHTIAHRPLVKPKLGPPKTMGSHGAVQPSWIKCS